LSIATTFQGSPYLAGFPTVRRETFLNLATTLFLLAHIGLAFLIDLSETTTMVHSVSMVVIGCFLITKRSPYGLIYFTAYVAGAEALWRASRSTLIYEYPKYVVSLFLILGLVRYGRIKLRNKAILFYFLLLIPSIFMLDIIDRKDISYNLSGPLTLTLACFFFDGVELNRAQVKRILICLVAPIISTLVLATLGTAQAEEVTYLTVYHDKVTTAGLAANQMSSILGLGILVVFLSLLLFKDNNVSRTLRAMLVIWLAAQAFLTFSRGGIYAATVGVLAMLFFQLRDQRSRATILGLGLLVILIFVFLVFPFLDRFTAGTLATRFRDTDTTGRTEIVLSDLIVFKNNYWLGVGPGGSFGYHAMFFREANAHTEYTRLLAEHGLLGLMAMIILARIVWLRFVRKSSPGAMALIAAFTIWSLFFMAHSAMRMAAPALLLGIAGANFNFAGRAYRESEAPGAEAAQPAAG